MKLNLIGIAFLTLALEVSASVVQPYGLCVHKMHLAEDRAAAFPVMTSHGVGYVRCDFNWEWIEPVKGEWNFAPFDALLDDAEKRGLKVLPILHHGAAWTKPLMDHLDDWRVYVRKCIERYGGRIEAIEIWNEANIHAFPGPIGDYAKVLKIASEEIRAAAPQVKITTSGWAGVAIGHMEYLYRHVGREAFDIVNFHHYSFGERPNGELEDCNLASEIGRLRDLMTKYGDRDKPMWLTECGYPTHDPSLVLHNIFKVQLPVFDPDRRNWRVRMVTLGTETENMVEGYARLMKEELPAGSDFKFVRANRLAGKLKEGGIDVIILPFHEKMPDGCTDELLAFIRQGGVVAQFGEAAMSYVVPQDADGVCRFRGGAPNGAATRRRFGFDVRAQYADPSVPGRQTAITNAASDAMGTEGVTVGMWTMRAGIPCSRWMTPVETTDLPGLEFTPLMTYTDGNGRAWTAAARLRLPGRKAGGLIISCGDEREENLYPATYARQARTLPRQYLYSQMLGCEDVFWYVYKTWEGTTDARRFNREPFFGIVRPNTEEPKPALVALKALAAARPVGSRTTPGLWRDEKSGFYFPQWTLPDGIPAGALWLRARTISEPPRGERIVSFGSDRMSFTDHLGRDITGAVKNLGGGRYALPLSEAVIYFRGGRFVTPAEEVLRQHAGAAHPRLFDIPKEIDGRLARAIVAAADGHLGQPPIERKFDESGRRLLQQAGKLRDRVIALASAYRLTKDVRYLEAAKREMLAGAAWTDWNPHHWLDTATMLEALAIGTDWLYDALDGETRATLRKACVDKGLRTIYAFEAETHHWRVSDNNWNTTCWGAVVMTLLAFNGELPDWSGSLFSEAIDALPRPVLLMAPKGAYAEGPSYWGSIIGHQLVIDALESALGTSFGLADVPGLKETADYRSWMEGTSGYLFNYSDSGWGTPYVKRNFCLAQLWLAKRFNRHDTAVFDRTELGRLLDGDAAASYGKLGVIPLLVSSWGITAPADADLKGPARPLDWYSGGTQPLVVMRSGDGPDAAYLGIKGGRSAASHGHDDSGTFVFDDAGVRWAVDLGSNPYQAIENTKINLWDNCAKEPMRWQVLRLSNRGHNVVTIDDEPFDNYGFADFAQREFSEKTATATLDLSQTYSRQAKGATRTFTLDRATHKLTIADDLTGLRPGARVTWRMYTPAQATLTPEGVVLDLGGHKKSLMIFTFGGGTWSVRPANDLRKEWDAALDGLTAVEFASSVPTDGRVVLTAILMDEAGIPSIPGGVCHVLNGEYDLPAGAMALWAIASE